MEDQKKPEDLFTKIAIPFNSVTPRMPIRFIVADIIFLGVVVTLLIVNLSYKPEVISMMIQCFVIGLLVSNLMMKLLENSRHKFIHEEAQRAINETISKKMGTFVNQINNVQLIRTSVGQSLHILNSIDMTLLTDTTKTEIEAIRENLIQATLLGGI